MSTNGGSVWLLILFVCFSGFRIAICSTQMPPTARINGGSVAEPNQFPWLAYIETDVGGLSLEDSTPIDNNASTASNFHQASKGYSFQCGATLISDRCLLTQSMCVPENVAIKTTVFLGLDRRSDYPNDPNVQTYETNQYYYLHEPLTFTTTDLVLIVLPVKLNLTDFIQPIHLPKLDGTESDHAGDNVTLAGWGNYFTSGGIETVSDGVRQVITTVITNSECRQFYSIVSSNSICASGKNGAGICQADGGTPMMYYDENILQWSLLGVAAFSPNDGCDKNRPSGYYRLQSPSVMSWIDSYCISKSPPFACPIDSSEIAYPDPEDCTAYYLCFEGEGPIRQVCPSGTAFNPWTRKCDFDYPECFVVRESHLQV